MRRDAQLLLARANRLANAIERLRVDHGALRFRAEAIAGLEVAIHHLENIVDGKVDYPELCPLCNDNDNLDSRLGICVDCAAESEP